MTDAKQPIVDNSLLIREYIEVRLNLLVVANDKLETEINRRFCAIEAATALAATGIDTRFKHLEQIVQLGQETSKRAVDKAEAAQAAHNVASNEWRGTLNDFKTTLVTKSEFDKLYTDFQSYRLEVARLFSAQAGEKGASKESRDTGFQYVGIIGGVIGAIFGALIAVGLAMFNNKASPVTTSVPNVIYMPAPQSAAPATAPR